MRERAHVCIRLQEEQRAWIGMVLRREEAYWSAERGDVEFWCFCVVYIFMGFMWSGGERGAYVHAGVSSRCKSLEEQRAEMQEPYRFEEDEVEQWCAGGGCTGRRGSLGEGRTTCNRCCSGVSSFTRHSCVRDLEYVVTCYLDEVFVARVRALAVMM